MKPKNNVLFLTRAWGESAGGMEKLSFEMINKLKESSRLNVSVIAPNITAGASLTVIRLKSALFALYVIPKAILAARRVDLVHIGDPVLAMAGWFISKFLKVPVVCHVHGLDIVYSNIFYQWYLKLFFNSFHAYLPISTHVKNILKKRNVKGKIHILNPGIKDKYYDPSATKKQVADIIGASVINKKILFTSGRLVKRKGHAWFLRYVMPKLPDNYIYIIAGSGSEKASIEKEIDRYNLADRVFLPGRVSTNQLRILYNAIDIFVQPNLKVSGDMEGFGLVLLEAALCDKLVVAHDIQGMTDAITDGQNGLLISYQNVGSWVKSLTEETKVIAARKYTLDKFSWDVIIKKYEDTFFSLI